MSHEGAAVWSQEFRFQAGSHIQLQAGQTMQGAINDASKPTAGGMASLAVPGYLPKGAVPGSPAALGASDLTPRGFVPSAKPQSPPLPGQRQPPAPRPRPNEQAA